MKRKAEVYNEYSFSKKMKNEEHVISLKRKFEEDNNLYIPNKKQKHDDYLEEYFKKILIENENLKKENQELKFFINSELENIKSNNENYIKSLSINHTNHFVF